MLLTSRMLSGRDRSGARPNKPEQREIRGKGSPVALLCAPYHESIAIFFGGATQRAVIRSAILDERVVAPYARLWRFENACASRRSASACWPRALAVAFATPQRTPGSPAPISLHSLAGPSGTLTEVIGAPTSQWDIPPPTHPDPLVPLNGQK